jgi:hypothetical protein
MSVDRAAWRDRITGFDRVAPDQLLANPANWRTHPGIQRDALRGSLDEVGWVDAIMVNTVTGHVVDGHARIEEALSNAEPLVPVLYVELTENEERIVLATFDPIGALADADAERLGALLDETRLRDDSELASLLAKIAEDNGVQSPSFEPIDESAEGRALDRLSTVTCPECGHEWKP